MKQDVDHELESVAQFETRKADHIRVAMDPQVQALGSGFDSLSFVHEALPEIDFHDVSLESQVFSGSPFARKLSSPFFISSMTAGHADSALINEKLARAAEAKGWAMGVGSQRRELSDATAALEWKRIRSACPSVVLYGNIGLSQLIQTDVEDVRRLIDALSAAAMIVHLNPLQEALQLEGTPRFRGGLQAIERLVRDLGCPVVIKETGCGISGVTAKRLAEAGVSAIDVAGRGGTHWGRIEGRRALSAQNNGAMSSQINVTVSPQSKSALGAPSARAAILADTAETMKDWGLSTVESVKQVARVLEATETLSFVSGQAVENRAELWASGGIRSGLDGAKAIALGATAIGVAQPLMAAVLKSEAALRHEMDRFDYELKTVLFCVGARGLRELKARGVLTCANEEGAV